MQSKLYKLLSQFCTISTEKEHSSFEILYVKTLIGLNALKTKSEDLGIIVAAVKAFHFSCYSYLFSFWYNAIK